MAEALKTFSFPVGGIADFYLEDHEKEALYKEKAQENFGSDGLGAIQDVAVRMASYGRYGDDKLVHAETGELVVPKALIDKNPKLKDSIFNHLKDMGIEDPERYVVGTESNSINPETGLPEFFLKDIFDKVGDVIRKVAKPVLTIAGSIFLGPVYGAALGAGIGGLIQGESLEQAFGSALTAGAGGALTAGIGGAMGAGGTAGGFTGFGQGVKQALTTNPLDAIGRMATGDFSNYYKNVKPPQATGAAAQGAGEQSAFNKLMFGEKPTADMLSEAGTKAYEATVKDLAANAPKNLDKSVLAQAQFEQGTAAANLAKANLQPSLLRQYGPSAALATGAAAAGGFFDAPEQDDLETPPTGQELIDKDPTKYLVQNIGPRTANPPFLIPTRFPLRQAPMQFAAEGGEIVQDNRSAPFSYPREFQNIIPPREDLDQRKPILFDEKDAPKREIPLRGMPIEQILDPNTFIFGTNDRDEKIEILKKMGRIQTAANGGEAGGTKEFPRRNGGIGMDEGTQGKDSVRAMLMPGEFVMTTDAVNGAGGGNNEKGIQNMYAMMRNFEAKARA